MKGNRAVYRGQKRDQRGTSDEDVEVTMLTQRDLSGGLGRHADRWDDVG